MKRTDIIRETRRVVTQVPVTKLPRETQYDIAGHLMETIPILSDDRLEYVISYFDVVDMPLVDIIEIDPRILYSQFDTNRISKLAVDRYADMIRQGTNFDPVLVSGNRFIDGGHRVAAHIVANAKMIKAVDIEPLLNYDWEGLF